MEAEKGSLIIAHQYARSLPIALESDLLIIKLAFDMFGIGSVLTRVRYDNDKMFSMNEKLGFRKFTSAPVNKITYDVLRLERGAFQPADYDQLLTYWSKRDERQKT